MEGLCTGCDGLKEYRAICRFFENDENSLDFFRSHGVIPSFVVCPKCNSNCVYQKEQHLWRCTKNITVAKKKGSRKGSEPDDPSV